jgi:hypothetical protein
MAQQYDRDSGTRRGSFAQVARAQRVVVWLCWLPAILALHACTAQTSSWNGAPIAAQNTAAQSAAPAACGADVKPAPLDASALNDAQLGEQMTQYFRAHCLPLVSARVARDSAGRREVVLYGFVASDFGKSDATQKAQQLLGSESLAIANNILVRPQIAAMAAQEGNGNGSAANNEIPGTPLGLPPGVQEYQAQQEAHSGSWASMLAPLLGGLSIGGGSFIGGSGVMVSPGMGGFGMYPGSIPVYPGYPPYPGAMMPYPGGMPIIP